MTTPPAIVIIGRPNVGKSTLFNRLVGRRQALVSDLPGLTRDRREGRTQLAGRDAVVVDTAGLEEAAAGTVPARMRDQSERAMATADVILFVIDAREGVVPADAAFARLALAHGRPTILIANKCEGRRGLDGMYEAYALGLGDPVPISAEHGEGLADLVTEIEAALGLPPPADTVAIDNAEPDETSADDGPTSEAVTVTRPLRVAIVGRPNVGKSTLVNALLGEERMLTGPEPGLTRDAVASAFNWKGRALRLHDTAGLRRKSRVTEQAEKLGTGDTIRAIRFAEVVVLLIDAERPFEHQDLTIGELVEDAGRAIVIAVNKWDLVTEKQRTIKAMRETVGNSLAQIKGVPLVPISALGERGLEQLMCAVFEANATWSKRVPTSELNRWLQQAMQRHAPPTSRGRRIRVRFITQPSTRPPTFVGFCQRAEAVPATYKRYLINSLRDTFKLAGVPIRLSFRKGKNPFAAH